jgi:peroxiredoxin
MKSYLAVFIGCFLFMQNINAQQQQFAIGNKAPAINTKASDGSSFNLEKATKNGAVIILFYRGYWCPYCNKQLKELNDSLATLQAKGATVVAITPENMEGVSKTINKTKATFTFISDTTNAILKLYGVNYTLDDKTVEKYKDYGIDLVKSNSNNESTLPVPAVYIIDKQGQFKYIWFEKDYRKRPSVKELLSYL